MSPICETSAVNMMNVDGAGAAKRRRERRLLSWLRHERMTVAAELSAALHHSHGGGQVKHVGLRAQKTDSPADGEEVVQATHEAPRGMRPGSLAEPKPQRSDRSLLRSPGETLLNVPSLADASAEAIDGRTLQFLFKKTLALKKKEDELRRKVEEQEQLKAVKEEEEDPDGWLQAFDGDGDLYYWHRRTRRAPPPSSSSAGKRGRGRSGRRGDFLAGGDAGRVREQSQNDRLLVLVLSWWL